MGQELNTIPSRDFLTRSTSLWSEQWFLLTSGNFATGKYNTMTVSWGSLGYIWQKPFVMVVVRPSRHTYQFMEEFNTFTLCGLAPEFQPAMKILGSKSGRDGDKITASGLTIVPATRVAAPAYAEAELIIECRKMYFQDLDPVHFLDPETHQQYPQPDYHRMYFGEILHISGIEKYMAKPE
jgi:flavin reductase (DIM6/NTAB) family NADH-FMN oxidoreductase RutF